MHGTCGGIIRSSLPFNGLAGQDPPLRGRAKQDANGIAEEVGVGEHGTEDKVTYRVIAKRN